MYNVLLCISRCLALILVVAASIWVEGVKRELLVHVNPGCLIPQCTLPGANDSAVNLVHIEAIGPNDTIHYLWSTINLPAIIVAQTSKAAALEANWSAILEAQNGALFFTEDPVHCIGLVLTQLWSYQDDEDTADMAKGSDITNLGVSDLLWKAIESPPKVVDSIISILISSSKNETIFNDDGSFNIEFSAGASPEQSDKYPHLGFSGNSTQMRILLNNLDVNKKERFAAEFMAVSTHSLNDTWTKDVRSSIDDEYSPGVFKVHMLYPPCENCSKHDSFLMWKPVAYLGDKPTIVNSSDAVMSEATYPTETEIPSSIVSMFFGNTKGISIVAWNMSFGTSGDGFYERTKYTSWSVMIGTGHPVFEKISMLAKIVIAVGLGAPGVIMLGGGVYLCYKKFRKDDDDLLLEG